MELLKALEKKTKYFNYPFDHWEINGPLTQSTIDEICNADIADPTKDKINYDGTRALDGGVGKYRLGINLLKCIILKPYIFFCSFSPTSLFLVNSVCNVSTIGTPNLIV